MLFPDFHYYGFKTSVKGKTKIYDMNDTSVVLPVGEEAYASVYRFSNQVAGLDSLANLPPGTLAYPDFVYFDFDSKDLDLAFEDAKTLCVGLQNLGAPYYFFFSGGKGFHVYVPSSICGIVPTSNTQHIKQFAETLAQGLKTFDPSIYNMSRIFRCANSFNLGGKLFKVPCICTDTLPDILLAAKSSEITPGLLEQHLALNWELHTVCQPLADLYQQCVTKYTTPEPQVHSRVVSEQEPKHNGSLFAKADEGRRNETAYTVARRLARRGIPLGDARQVMTAVWNGQACKPPLPTAELLKVVENAYSKGTNEFVDEGNYAGKIIDIKGGMESIARKFLSQQTGFLTGYEMLDNYTMGFGPEELVWIAGRSGSFKSAVLTNILQRGSKLAKKPALFFSMEMGPETLVPRMIQQAEGITKREVITALRAGNPLSSYQKTMEDFEFLKVVHLSNLTTEQVLGLIDYHIETYGELSAVGFDYLGLFKGVNNNTERTAKQAQEIKTIICKAARCPVFCLTQAKQVYEGREGDIELDRSCPKDSDSILDLGDYAIGLWGHWAQDQITGVETKFQFGKFFKSRGMDEDKYGVNPYFGLNLDKQFMRLNDVVHIAHPPQFKTKNGEKE
jgi:replicative DNA helicase